MVRRTQDLHTFDTDYEDYSLRVIDDIKNDYKYDENKEIPKTIFYDEKNKIDGQIFKAIFIIAIPTYLVTEVLMIDTIDNALILLFYIILVLLASCLTAGILMVIISCIFSSIIKQKIIPLIVRRKYK